MGLLVALENITKVFSAVDLETEALAGVHLTIHRGEFVAISGPSGCGKTTLLSIIGFLDSPSGGRYAFDGEPTDGLSLGRKSWLRSHKVGFIFQNFNLIGDLTVAENVELALSYQQVPPSQRRQRAAEALDRVNMAHRTRHFPSQLSGGQQQRVAVARALVGNPAILLADEPTGNLDSRNGHAIMEMLSQVNRSGTTICIVTHDPRYAGYAGRTITMLDGKIVTEHTKDQR
jgi:putative ABC transport system ATP-binding protein